MQDLNLRPSVCKLSIPKRCGTIRGGASETRPVIVWNSARFFISLRHSRHHRVVEAMRLGLYEETCFANQEVHSGWHFRANPSPRRVPAVVTISSAFMSLFFLDLVIWGAPSAGAARILL